MKLLLVCVVLVVIMACGHTPTKAAEPAEVCGPELKLLLLGCEPKDEVLRCAYLGVFEGPQLCLAIFEGDEPVSMVCGVKLVFPPELKEASR